MPPEAHYPDLECGVVKVGGEVEFRARYEISSQFLALFSVYIFLYRRFFSFSFFYCLFAVFFSFVFFFRVIVGSVG